jgi:tyrosinase
MMAYTQAPVDPVFYSHHSLIDLLQTIYLKCQLGDETTYLSTASKGSDPRFWASCAKPGGGNFSSTDTIAMRVTSANNSKVYVNAWEDPNNMLYPFFRDLPHTYGDYIDAKDLGSYSYTYEISGGLANMYANCVNSNTLDAVSASTALLTNEEQGTVVKNAVLKRGDKPLCPKFADGTDEDDAMERWTVALFESARIIGLEDWAARQQVEMISCLHHCECIGPVEDYTYLYRANFGIQGHTRCFSIIDDLVNGTRVIAIPKWRDITRRFLPCPLRDEVAATE